MWSASNLLRRIGFAVAFGTVWSPASWKGNATTAPAQGCLCGTLADEFRAADAGLVREWVVQVPFDSAAFRLDGVTVGDGLVVAQAGDGSLHAIRADGTVAWSTSIGAAAGHAWPATIGSRLVIVTSESAVHALDRDGGALEWERPTGALTAAAAVQADDWIYAPLQSDRLLRLPVNPLARAGAEQRQPATDGTAATPDGSPSPAESLAPLSIAAGGPIDQAPAPLPNGVLWTTSSSLVALERTPLGWFRHELPETGPPSQASRERLTLAGAPVVRGNSIFIASADAGIARIDLNAPGKPGLRAAWTAALPDRAAAGTLVSGSTVLVSIGPSGFVALAADDGRELWRSDLVGTLVAIAGDRAWILDQVGRLTALDLATGLRRGSACVGCFTLPIVNTASERLLLASPGGLVVSLAAPPVTTATNPDAAAPTRAAAPVSGAEPEPAAEPASEDPDTTPP